MKSQCTVGHTITYLLWAPNLFFLFESLRCFVSHWEVFWLAALYLCMANELT